MREVVAAMRLFLRNLVHFSLKIRHLVATIFILTIVFVQLLSSKNADLSQWRGFDPPTPFWLRHWFQLLNEARLPSM